MNLSIIYFSIYKEVKIFWFSLFFVWIVIYRINCFTSYFIHLVSLREPSEESALLFIAM